MDNISQDEYRKIENEEHHPYNQKYLKDSQKKYKTKGNSHVYSSPLFLKKSLGKLFSGGGKNS